MIKRLFTIVALMCATIISLTAQNVYPSWHKNSDFHFTKKKLTTQSNFTMMVIGTIDGERCDSAFEIGVFCGDECREVKAFYANKKKPAIGHFSSLVVNGVEGADKLKLGKNFEVPSVDDLISTQLPYNALNKQVYYLVPGSATYSSTSALSGTPKFKVSAYGKYVYYVLLSSDNLTDNKKDAVKMTVDYLKEELDGFYQYVEEGTNKNVFYNGETKKFYASKDEAKEGEGTEIANAVKGKLIVPKFTFELENEGPVIDITSAYQENGYIGASYRVSSITVNGSESTTYTLYYKESLNATAIDVTEEENFDTTNLTFTPSKAGIYYVEVTAVDSVGTPAHGKTANIKVSSKYSTVTYKVGFADWLEKNTLPFVLLCVSGACLIAIICLLFIKPKDATAQKVLKKVDEKDADR